MYLLHLRFHLPGDLSRLLEDHRHPFYLISEKFNANEILSTRHSSGLLLCHHNTNTFIRVVKKTRTLSIVFVAVILSLGR